MEGRLEMIGPRRFAGQKRKHDSSAEGEAKETVNSAFSHNQLLSSHYPMMTNQKEQHVFAGSPLRKEKQNKKTKKKEESVHILSFTFPNQEPLKISHHHHPNVMSMCQLRQLKHRQFLW